METGGFKIATIRGIPIRIHLTFLLILPLLAFGFARAFSEAAQLAEVPAGQLVASPFVWGLGVALALFLSVLVHELAHSLYAQRTGGRVVGITLLMFGGVSQISEPPKDVRHEAVMALVGPAVSLVLGVVLYALHRLAVGTSFNMQFALFYLASLNLFLGIFNLLPAFPMDGGRILRAVLARRMGLVRATRAAATVGKLFAVLFGIWGFLSFNMLLLVIAFFVFVGAEAETRAVLVKAAIGKLRVADLMSQELASVAADVSVEEAAVRMIRARRLAFPVTADGEPLGLVTVEAVQRVPPDRRRSTAVREITVPAPPLSPADDASEALRLMSETDAPELVVSVDGRLTGTVSRDDIVRALKLSELEGMRERPGGWSMGRRDDVPT